MLSALSVSQMDRLHMDLNQPGLLPANGLKYAVLSPQNNTVGSSVTFVPQLPMCTSSSLPYLAWLQGVHSALAAMNSSRQLIPIQNHSDLTSVCPFTDLPANLTNSSVDPTCSPVSRSTPMPSSNPPQDPDQPLALVIRKYTDHDRLRDGSPHNCSSSSGSVSTTSSHTSSANSSHSSATDAVHPRPKSKLTNRNRTQVRRIKANARERSRVHTISAAFETLRQIVPTCPTTPRLSKLSVLRVASCYIDALRTCLEENPQPIVTEQSDTSDGDA